MRKPMRNKRVNVIFNNEDNFEVVKDDKVIFSSEQDFYIYLTNVNLMTDGTINGRFMGETSDVILDSECIPITFNEGVGWIMKTGRRLTTCRMLAIRNNYHSTIIIK